MQKYNYINIPQELKGVKQWVCWAKDKIPRNPYTGNNAQSNNPDTWSDFDTALQSCDKYGFEGVGFMFAPPYFGVDLDDCFDNRTFIDEFVNMLQSYTEISQSGCGIHIICKGKIPEGSRRKGKVEMYDSRRYFAMTGNLYTTQESTQYKAITDCTTAIKPLYAKYLAPNVPKVAPQRYEPITMDDSEIINKARHSAQGRLFELLYAGEWQGLSYPSQSEADFAFLCILAFWTQRNKQQMERIFCSSGLYRPEKFNRKESGTTHGLLEIEKACLRTVEVYQPRKISDDTSIALTVFGKDNAVTPIVANNYDLSDTGNAQRFVDKFVGNIKYSFVHKRWYFWTGKVWSVDLTGEIKRLADSVIDDLKRTAFAEEDPEAQKEKLKFAQRTASSKCKEAMIKEAQHLLGVPVLPEEMDAYTDYFNCESGVINMRNGEILPHDSNFLLSHMSFCEYDESGARPKLWLQFVDDVTGGDKALQDYLQRCVGYSLTGSVKEQCLFYLYGLGCNGKSTFLDIITELAGTYASHVSPDTIMAKRTNSSGASGDLARLKSARLVTCEEADEGMRFSEGLVKELTGGEEITCRFLYGDDFQYKPEFKIWIAANHKCIIRGTDNGIWRRIRMIPFEVTIPPEKIDKGLKWKLRKELPQILNWAMQGCLKWLRDGLEPPTAVKKATAEYRNEMDVLASFMEDCIIIDYSSRETISASDLYSLYKRWASETNEYCMRNKKFGQEMTAKLPEKKRTSKGNVYCNIRLTEYAQKLLLTVKNWTIEDFE